MNALDMLNSSNRYYKPCYLNVSNISKLQSSQKRYPFLKKTLLWLKSKFEDLQLQIAKIELAKNQLNCVNLNNKLDQILSDPIEAKAVSDLNDETASEHDLKVM